MEDDMKNILGEIDFSSSEGEEVKAQVPPVFLTHKEFFPVKK